MLIGYARTSMVEQVAGPPRIVLPAHPHHFTQRGNRREQTVFEAGDLAPNPGLLIGAAGQSGWMLCRAKLHSAPLFDSNQAPT